MTFDDAWAHARDVEGWLTEAQARRLFAAARRVAPMGRIVEIGSFRGRSAIVLAGAGAGVEVVCIDPHAGSDRGPQEIAADADRGRADHEAFHANLARAGVAERVRHLRAFSDAALEQVPGPVDVLFVDGAHRFGPARADLARWGERVRPGGRMLVHDAWSSVGVTLALLTTTVSPVAGATSVARDRWRSSCATTPTARATRCASCASCRGSRANVARCKALILARLRAGSPWPY